jgi:hypothetical protein
MTRQVYLENWWEQLEATIEFLTPRVAWMSDGRERDALSSDLDSLREMRRQVCEVPPSERTLRSSLVLRIQIDDPISLPPDLIARIAELFEIYRRFRSRLGEA